MPRSSRGTLLCGLLTASCFGSVLRAEGEAAISDRFERAYSTWRRYIQSQGIGSSSDGPYINNQPFQEIVALGPQAVPLIIAKASTDPGAHFLVHALSKITRKVFSVEQRLRHGYGNQAQAALWREWWRGGEAETEAVFREGLEGWRQLRARGDTMLWTDTASLGPGYGIVRTKRELTDLGRAYMRMADLGIEALPLIVDAIANGQTDLAPLVEHITAGEARLQGSITEAIKERCAEWWSREAVRWQLPRRGVAAGNE
ncbi:MAG: hypothetical protein COY42_34850 [Armatimonadetes bacterium CG_4_10_14_0_8_um_filter_66_14]|nr:MAG: hypothetical protein COY42_34850 [Armatimonadetes bacterium CG_4_10_14_0_8_um_filter_66_14]